MATPEPSPKKTRIGLDRHAIAPTPTRAIRADDNVLVCVICEKTSKSQDPGGQEHSLAFPRKIACQYCLWYYPNMHPHIEWPMYSAAFTGSEGSSANIVLVKEVKTDLLDQDLSQGFRKTERLPLIFPQGAIPGFIRISSDAVQACVHCCSYESYQ